MSVVDASRRAEGGGRKAEGWPTEHTEHTEEFLIGGNGVNGGRRAVPNPRAGKPVPRGMGFPAHVGATADRRSRRAAHAIWQQARLNTSSEVLGAYD